MNYCGGIGVEEYKPVNLEGLKYENLSLLMTRCPKRA
jgi:hypothetical protein